MRVLTHTRCAIIVICLLFVTDGCSTGEIANLEQIRVEDTVHRYDVVTIVISLRDGAGDALVWVNTSIGPQGGGVLSESDLDTEVRLYSTRDGRENKEVYHGRLRDLRWNQIIIDSPRILFGDIPIKLIASDPERDSPLGIIELTLKTPKQGDFFTREEQVQIYGW